MRVFSFLGLMQMGGPLNKNRLLEDCRRVSSLASYLRKREALINPVG